MQNLDLKLPIREEYSKLLPFTNLHSRNTVAIVFAFYGDREEVCNFMQGGSHKTRAYFFNETGLKGFLVNSTIVHVL